MFVPKKRKNIFEEVRKKRACVKNNFPDFINSDQAIFQPFVIKEEKVDNQDTVLEMMSKMMDKIDRLNKRMATIEDMLEKDQEKKMKIEDLTYELNSVKMDNEELKYRVDKKKVDIDYYA